MPAKKNQTTESLATFVKRTRLGAHLSLNDVVERSGNQISNTYAWNIENGRIKCPSARKLKALAKGLGCSEDELYALSRGIGEPDGFKESRFWELFNDYEKLSKPLQKKVVDAYLHELSEMMKPWIKK